MRLSASEEIHLTYCSNIHPGESLSETRRELELHLPELKKRLSPDHTFGTGLRLSAAAARALNDPVHLKEFKSWLEQEGLYVFTLNGFPYGSFHGTVVKDQVYAPDWRNDKRVSYTRDLIQILRELLPEGNEGSISTSPLSYKPWFAGEETEELFQKSVSNLTTLAWELHQLEESSGKYIHLDIEPEPDCILENSEETIQFFQSQLFPNGSKLLVKKYQISPEQAHNLLARHIKVCYDTCHFAVEYEKADTAIQSLLDAGIGIGKIQISAALQAKTKTDMDRAKVSERLRDFAESTYLHQTIGMSSSGRLQHFNDLPEALQEIESSPSEEWRIHYHVPIFLNRFGPLQSTRDDISETLDLLKRKSFCKHLEIETYTWEVLPDELKSDITDSVEREYRWVLSEWGSGKQATK